MRVIALESRIRGVIRRILEHLGRGAPQVKERGPPLDFASWHHCSIAVAQDAGDGRIDFPISTMR
jgi:hypothetical protein